MIDHINEDYKGTFSEQKKSHYKYILALSMYKMVYKILIFKVFEHKTCVAKV